MRRVDVNTGSCFRNFKFVGLLGSAKAVCLDIYLRVAGSNRAGHAP